MRQALLVPVFLLVGWLAPAASAQIVPIPNTGCSNQTQAPLIGSPTLGGSITISSSQFPCNSPGTSGFVAIGFSGLISPPQPFACFNGINPCVFIIPDVVSAAPISFTQTINIPNNPALIGGRFQLQSGCLATFLPPPGLGACFSELNQALQVTVM